MDSSGHRTTDLSFSGAGISDETFLNQAEPDQHGNEPDSPPTALNDTVGESFAVSNNLFREGLASNGLNGNKLELPNQDAATTESSLAFVNPLLQEQTPEMTETTAQGPGVPRQLESLVQQPGQPRQQHQPWGPAEPRPFRSPRGSWEPRPFESPRGPGEPRPFRSLLGPREPRPIQPSLGSGGPRPFQPAANSQGIGQSSALQPGARGAQWTFLSTQNTDANRARTPSAGGIFIIRTTALTGSGGGSAVQSAQASKRAGRRYCAVFLCTLLLGCGVVGGIIAGVISSQGQNDGGLSTLSPDYQDGYRIEAFEGSLEMAWQDGTLSYYSWPSFANNTARTLEKTIQNIYGFTIYNDRVTGAHVKEVSKEGTKSAVQVLFQLFVKQSKSSSSQSNYRDGGSRQLYDISATDLRYAFLQGLTSFLDSWKFTGTQKSMAYRIERSSVSFWRGLKPTTQAPFTPEPFEPDLDSNQCGEVRTLPSLRIVGGTVAEKGVYPWMVMITKEGDFKCGGSILDPLHVITAAHCLEREPKYYSGLVNTRSNNLMVIAGKDLSSTYLTAAQEQKVSVAYGYMHDSFSSSPIHNDIAVLRLAKPLVLDSRVSTICLPKLTDIMPKRCVVAGWGATEYYTQSLPSAMRTVSMWTYNRSECLQTFSSFYYDGLSMSYYLKPGVFCAANGTVGGQDSCQGDSGGPLFCLMSGGEDGGHYSQFGVVSWGDNCGKPGSPGFYTYLPSFRSWIYLTALPKLNQSSSTQTTDRECRSFSPLADYDLRSCRTVLNKLKNDKYCEKLQEAVNCTRRALASNGHYCQVEDVYNTIVTSYAMRITGLKLKLCEASKVNLVAGRCKNLTAVSAAVHNCISNGNCLSMLEATLCVHRYLDPDWLQCSRQDIQTVIMDNFNSSFTFCQNKTTRNMADGRDFLYLNNGWLAVCGDSWGHNEVKVVCKQRGFRNGTASLVRWSKDKMYVSHSLYALGWVKVTCTRAESSLADCKLDPHASCSGSYMAASVCYNSAYSFELAPFHPDGHYGYVRLSRDQGQGLVCLRDLTERAADLLCREAGYVAGMVFSRPHSAAETGLVWSGDVDCGDGAVDIYGCERKTEWALKQQKPFTCHLAAIFCFASSVRFHNGLLNSTGIVQMYRQTQNSREVILKTVCGDAFTNTTADVMCRHNGFPRGGHVMSFNPFYRLETEYVSLSCTGHESLMDDCRVTDSPDCSSPAVVKCNAPQTETEPDMSVKLLSNPGPVLVYSGGQWGTICPDHWSNLEARVVCKQLGYTHGYRNASTAPRVFPHVLHDVRCQSNDSSLRHCSFWPVLSEACLNQQPAAVACTNIARPEYRLQSESNKSNEGQVYMYYNGTTAPVVISSSYFSSSQARTLCQDLGFVTGVANGSATVGYVQHYWKVTYMYYCPTGSDLHSCLFGEPTLHQCSYTSNCLRYSSYSSPTVFCYKSAARFRSGAKDTAGVVQLYRDERWLSIRSSDVTQSTADVICRDIRGSPTAAAVQLYGYIESTYKAQANCDSRNANVTSAVCISVNVSSTSYNTPAALACYDGQRPNGNITGWKKDDSTYGYYGATVLLQRYGLWGTVCSDYWSHTQARLLCKHLGYTSGSSGTGTLRSSDVPMWALRVYCSSSAVAIEDCHVTLTDVNNGVNDCTSRRMAAVECHYKD